MPIRHDDDHRNGYRGFPARLGFEIVYPDKEPRETVLAETPPARLVEREAVAGPGATRNKLVHGDNLGVLKALLDDPTVAGQVRLVYIDPPFGTRLVFVSKKEEPAYHDKLGRVGLPGVPAEAADPDPRATGR